MASLQFKINHTDSGSSARAGTITTDHGVISTPIFMPVGTVGSVKAVLKSYKGLKYHLDSEIKD